jgi:hypothetical protein
MKCAWTAAQIWVMHEHLSGSGPALRLLLLVCDEIGRCLKRFVRTPAPITWILNVLVLDCHLQICQMSMSSGSEEENGRNSAVEVRKARSPSLVNKPSEPTSLVVRPLPTRWRGLINRRVLAVPMRPSSCPCNYTGIGQRMFATAEFPHFPVGDQALQSSGESSLDQNEPDQQDED